MVAIAPAVGPRKRPGCAGPPSGDRPFGFQTPAAIGVGGPSGWYQRRSWARCWDLQWSGVSAGCCGCGSPGRVESRSPLTMPTNGSSETEDGRARFRLRRSRFGPPHPSNPESDASHARGARGHCTLPSTRSKTMEVDACVGWMRDAGAAARPPRPGFACRSRYPTDEGLARRRPMLEPPLAPVSGTTSCSRRTRCIRGREPKRRPTPRAYQNSGSGTRIPVRRSS